MVLKIYDEIVDQHEKDWRVMLGGSEGVAFSDIDDFVNRIPEEDGQIDILLHCRGGVVSEGWAIVDRLRATGKKITATIDGVCASMAVSVLLAASERRAQPHATIHIHKPYFPPFTLADAYNEDDLKRMASDLENETGKMLDWYVERTGADRAELEALMIEDKDINVEEAMRLGFVHSVVEPMSASTARREWKANHQKDMANTKDKAGVLSALANFLGIKVNIEENVEPVNYVLMTADGKELTINKPEGEDVAVGDEASPDGEFVLEDGRTVVVADGKVTEIREPEPEEKPEEEPMEESEEEKEIDKCKKENEELKARIAELEAQVKNEDEQTILDMVQKAGGAGWLEEVAKSNYVPSQRKVKSAQVEKTSHMAERLAELKAKNNK